MVTLLSNTQQEMNIYPNAKQFRFMNSTTRHTAYGGARGGGKSWVIRIMAIMLASMYGAPDAWSAGIRICIIRRTLQDLTKNHLEALKLLTKGIAKYNANDKCFYFRNGAIIQFAYCDNDNDADHFQGIEYDIIFIEEATQLKEEWIKKIAASCRGVNEFPHRVFYTCNPGGPGHAYIKRLFVDRIFQGNEKPEDYSFIQAKVTDNKILQQYSPEYVNFLENLPPTIRKAWLEGDWNIFQGSYFPEFVNAPEHYQDGLWTHVIDPIPIRQHWTIYRGLDWGHYRPFSVGWFAVDEYETMYHFKELYGCQKSGRESIPDMGVQWPPEQVFRTIREIEDNDPVLKGRKIIGVADPAIFKTQGGPSIADTAIDCGVYFQPGDNTRLAGWMQCRYRLQFNEYGRPRFQVFNTCTEFLRCMNLWMHDPKNVEDLDTTLEDHIADMWRYVAMANIVKALVEEPEYNPMWGMDPLNMFGGRAG
jgi:PBSX family phage terminase large subunit